MQGDNDDDDRLVVGGAFYDLASQCLTPLVGGRGGPVNGGLWSDVVKARRAGDSSGSQGGANGTIRATYSFAESFDGTSSLQFTGVLNEKTTASFPLYSCDVPLPAEPLEIRLTFCGNADSEMALLLSLDVPGQLGGRREVVLRDWGKEGAPKKQQAIFSKRLTFTETKATYCPVREESGRGLSAAASAEDGLQARVRALRDAGESYDAIRTRLGEERNGRADSPSSAAATGTSLSSTWITRTYVVRDLRMGGSRAIREVSLVCARRRKSPTLSTQGEGGEKVAARSAWSALPGGRRLEDSGGGVSNAGGRSGAERRGVAGLAAYRAFLGEVVIGPWRRETPSTFGRIEGLRAEEVACFYGEGETGGGGGGGGGGGIAVDLSLAWESEGCVGRGRGSAKRDGVFGAGSPWATLHCDVWGVRGGEEEGGGGHWRWLGRAYGQKYRLTNLRVGGGGGGREGGGARGEATSGSSLVLAVQQVNAMGYREPVEDWARLHLCLP
ncbi:unnamed protein product [Ectocarpus sp. CCAP 1310/34]|nr:unnamed protein product [Ectocarpus sp. CCAP 1310/34]